MPKIPGLQYPVSPKNARQFREMRAEKALRVVGFGSWGLRCTYTELVQFP